MAPDRSWTFEELIEHGRGNDRFQPKRLQNLCVRLFENVLNFGVNIARHNISAENTYPKKLNVSGLPSPRARRFCSAKRPNSILFSTDGASFAPSCVSPSDKTSALMSG